MKNVNAETRVFAILGNPVAHSLSPGMYNEAFAYLGMNSIYVAFKVAEDSLGQAVAGMKSLGVWGGNVTIPLKEKIIPYLDGITEEARLIGAVNTFRREEDKLMGTNTDGVGFIKALTKAYPDALTRKKALLLGAGGSARAVAAALALAGIKEITVINRNIDKARDLAQTLEKAGAAASCLRWGEAGLADAFRDSKLVINTTSLGMAPHIGDAPPYDSAWLSPRHLVVDLIYRPARTRFLREAGERGCQTMNGLGMLLEQGVLTFEYWYPGATAPVEVMARELERRLK